MPRTWDSASSWSTDGSDYTYSTESSWYSQSTATTDYPSPSRGGRGYVLTKRGGAHPGYSPQPNQYPNYPQQPNYPQHPRTSYPYPPSYQAAPPSDFGPFQPYPPYDHYYTGFHQVEAPSTIPFYQNAAPPAVSAQADHRFDPYSEKERALEKRIAELELKLKEREQQSHSPQIDSSQMDRLTRLSQMEQMLMHMQHDPEFQDFRRREAAGQRILQQQQRMMPARTVPSQEMSQQRNGTSMWDIAVDKLQEEHNAAPMTSESVSSAPQVPPPSQASEEVDENLLAEVEKELQSREAQTPQEVEDIQDIEQAAAQGDPKFLNMTLLKLVLNRRRARQQNQQQPQQAVSESRPSSSSAAASEKVPPKNSLANLLKATKKESDVAAATSPALAAAVAVNKTNSPFNVEAGDPFIVEESSSALTEGHIPQMIPTLPVQGTGDQVKPDSSASTSATSEPTAKATAAIAKLSVKPEASEDGKGQAPVQAEGESSTATAGEGSAKASEQEKEKPKQTVKFILMGSDEFEVPCEDRFLKEVLYEDGQIEDFDSLTIQDDEGREINGWMEKTLEEFPNQTLHVDF